MTQLPITDQRVLSGMRKQLDARAARINAGAKPLGWKAGFGAPAALEGFKLAGPLSGYMLTEGLVISGARVSLQGWIKPVAEPEVAIWFGKDISSASDLQDNGSAIKGIGPAIELADLDTPPADVAEILAGNIYHRHVILGACDTTRAGARIDGLTCEVTRNGEALPPALDIEANTGRIIDIARHTAATLITCGAQISSGDVLICGSILPPLFLDANDTALEHALDPLGAISVRFS
jgi:2-keto-4-pentenoate hydratase